MGISKEFLSYYPIVTNKVSLAERILDVQMFSNEAQMMMYGFLVNDICDEICITRKLRIYGYVEFNILLSKDIKEKIKNCQTFYLNKKLIKDYMYSWGRIDGNDGMLWFVEISNLFSKKDFDKLFLIYCRPND